MALVVNKHQHSSKGRSKAITVSVTTGDWRSSAWILLNDSPLINSNLVWFGTATSAFMGYFYDMDIHEDKEGQTVYTFTLLPSDITPQFAISQGADSRLHNVVMDSGIYGECARGAWGEITNKDSGCDLYIEDKEDILTLVSAPAPEKPVTLKPKAYIAFDPVLIDVPEFETDLKYLKWLLDHPVYKPHPYLHMQLNQDYIDDTSPLRTLYYGIPELVDAKHNGYFLIRTIGHREDAEIVLNHFPNLDGKLRLIYPDK